MRSESTSAAYLLDSSAVVNSVKRGMASAVSLGAVLELTRYEALNAVWKEWVLLKRIEREDALELAGLIVEALRHARTVSVVGRELGVLALAADVGLTFYDASALHAAKSEGLTLVTDDEKLAAAAKRKGVRVLSTSQFLDEVQV